MPASAEKQTKAERLKIASKQPLGVRPLSPKKGHWRYFIFLSTIGQQDVPS